MSSLLIEAGTDQIFLGPAYPSYTGLTAVSATYDAFAVAGWFQLATSTAGTTRRVVGTYKSDDSGETSICRFDSSGENMRPEKPGNLGSFDTLNATPAVGDWCYYAITGRTSALDFWIWDADGNLLAEEAGSAHSKNGVTIETVGVGGRGFYRGDGFQLGKAAYWKVWNVNLSKANFESQIFRSDWVVGTSNQYSGFDASATDTSGNARDWTILGSPTVDSDTPPVSDGDVATILMTWTL